MRFRKEKKVYKTKIEWVGKIYKVCLDFAIPALTFEFKTYEAAEKHLKYLLKKLKAGKIFHLSAKDGFDDENGKSGRSGFWINPLIFTNLYIREVEGGEI